MTLEEALQKIVELQDSAIGNMRMIGMLREELRQTKEAYKANLTELERVKLLIEKVPT